MLNLTLSDSNEIYHIVQNNNEQILLLTSKSFKLAKPYKVTQQIRVFCKTLHDFSLFQRWIIAEHLATVLVHYVEFYCPLFAKQWGAIVPRLGKSLRRLLYETFRKKSVKYTASSLLYIFMVKARTKLLIRVSDESLFMRIPLMTRPSEVLCLLDLWKVERKFWRIVLMFDQSRFNLFIFLMYFFEMKKYIIYVFYA